MVTGTSILELNPEDLSSAERIEITQEYRNRVIEGGEASVTDAELRKAIDILRYERSLGGTRSKESKPVVKPTSLDTF